ncbi:hypothetical protein Terro_0055 [Terriglobus roseus DSM 18391]|uniref:Uncharacterized protein n=1 Tax=Terriglobus roseus (strain DSM 18391 / NRRL B-41598 / KBS 63) TaxID=926566 RepID=I3ZAY9_TERRK|nr:hypothetical protein [Terriglobus roseus]AFL86407.1 hypothetical protein Terro_0055 [Terriglobus roseus DSM 18391]
MPVLDVEACKSFVYANRIIADHFKATAQEVLEAVQTFEDTDTRLRLADLSRTAEERAAQHENLAELQERDMGVRCHCPNVAVRAV